MVRVFIGIFLPENLQNFVVSLQERLGSFPIECKLVEKENLHISLDFLGEVDAEALERIRREISDLTDTTKSFQIDIGNLRLLPNRRIIRIVAADVHSTELEILGKKLAGKIGGDAKPPHLTLCRIKKVYSKTDFLKKFEEIENEKIGSFKVTAIQLIKSELHKEGPVYSVVSEFPLP